METIEKQQNLVNEGEQGERGGAFYITNYLLPDMPNIHKILTNIGNCVTVGHQSGLDESS